MKKYFIFSFSLYLLFTSVNLFAHGERAQQAGLRMRTLNWFDFTISQVTLEVNETITVSGKFVPSVWWPDHMASPEHAAYLNVSSPGPAFVRLDSRVNGEPTIRSQRYKMGELYEFEIILKARTPGRYHIHPVLNVKGTGPLIGPGLWVEITGDQADFENSIVTLTKKTVDLESVGLKEVIWLHTFWIIVALAWFGYWFRKLPVIMPRFKAIEDGGDEAGNALITIQDMIVAFGFFLFTLVSITVLYFWTQEKYPITTPLQTSTFDVPILHEQADSLDIELIEARYRIPGRSFKVTMDIKNNSDHTYRIGEFLTANLRFINRDVLGEIKPRDENDLMASTGLFIEGNEIKPKQTSRVIIYADDALWETYRLTSLIYDPDSRFAGMLFFYDENNEREHYEIGGPMLPAFN